MGFRQNSAAEKSRAPDLVAVLAQNRDQNPGRSQKYRGNAPTFSKKKQVALTSKAKAMGFRQHFCYGNSQVSGSLVLRDQGSNSDRSQE
jgi:hypothetical protein